MGWLWSTPDTLTPANTTNTSLPVHSTTEPDSSPPPTTTSARSLSQDELAEQELRAFLQELEADTKHTNHKKYTRLPRPQQPRSGITTSPSSAILDDDTLSEELLPKTMSCRDAFDSAFYCNSLGGQFNNLYRYGTVRACSENWNDFWFCMKTRSYGTKEKEEAIRQRYREKEQRKYGSDPKEEGVVGVVVGRSSEYVWRSREKKMEWGEAFNAPFPEIGGDDAEWNRRERLRRAEQVQGTMGS